MKYQKVGIGMAHWPYICISELRNAAVIIDTTGPTSVLYISLHIKYTYCKDISLTREGHLKQL